MKRQNKILKTKHWAKNRIDREKGNS